MAKGTVKRTIDGTDFEFMQLAPKAALKVLTRITKVLLEPLGMLGLNVTNGDAIKSLLAVNLPPNVLATALSAMASRLDEDEVVQTVEILLGNVLMRGAGDKGTRQVVIDVDFVGETKKLLTVVAVALEVNFSDFFGGSNVPRAPEAPAAALTT